MISILRPLFRCLSLVAVLSPARELCAREATEADRLIAGGGFYRVEELPLKPRNLERDAAATIELGSRCSSAVLSPDGYVATNVHCVVDCLLPAYDYEPQIDVQQYEEEGRYTITAIREQVPRRLQCKDVITTRFGIFDLPVTGPRIVWLGRGRQSYRNDFLSKLPENIFRLIRDHNEDVAILKFDVIPGNPPLKCIPLGEPAREGDLLWAIGYPDETHRGNGRDSNGRGKFVSFGRLTSAMDRDPALNAVAGSLAGESERRLFWDRVRAIWSQPHLLQTNLDAFHRNSGSPIIDEQGGLQAILSSITKATGDVYSGNTVTGIRMQNVRDEIENDLGKEAAQAIFNCPRAP